MPQMAQAPDDGQQNWRSGVMGADSQEYRVPEPWLGAFFFFFFGNPFSKIILVFSYYTK